MLCVFVDGYVWEREREGGNHRHDGEKAERRERTSAVRENYMENEER